MTIGTHGRLGIIALIGFLGPGSLPSFAEPPSSPAEKAETVQLNHDIAAANAAADARYAAAEKQYDEQKAENDRQQQRYQEEVKQTEALQQQYQDKLRAYQKAYPKKD